jgi:hypothetical protein
VTKRVIAGEGEQVHVRFSQIGFYLDHIRQSGIPMPLTEALWAFIEKGAPRIYERPRYKRAGRMAPSLWYELTNRKTDSHKGDAMILSSPTRTKMSLGRVTDSLGALSFCAQPR